MVANEDNTTKTISTVAVSLPVLDEQQMELLDKWIRAALWEGYIPLKGGGSREIDIHRLKGRVVDAKEGKVMIIQGVREVFEFVEPVKQEGGNLEGKLVFIGRHLTGREVEQSLERYVIEKHVIQ